jgi:1,2-diacylglycerol 3-alpha-glucosyltransferase
LDPLRIAALFDMLGPYHVARIDALARHADVLGLEVASRSGVYEWDRVEEPVRFERQTLFDVADSRQIPYPEIAQAVVPALTHFRPDVVLIPGWASRGALAALGWCLARKTPAVAMSETTASDHVRASWKERLKRQILGCFRAGLVGGEPQRAYLASLGMDEKTISLGYNAVDNAHFCEGAARARADATLRTRLGTPEHFFLASARFIPIKNLIRLLEAFARFRQMRPETRTGLVLLGDGEQRRELEALRSRLNLKDFAVFPGFRQYNELPGYYGLAAAFIHISRIEPWGLVVNEAMAAGLPVVVSRQCGCADTLVRDGENGFVVPYDSIEVIAERLAQLDIDDALRARMGARSQEIVAAWSPERFVQGACEAAAIALAHGPAQATLARRAVLAAVSRQV